MTKFNLSSTYFINETQNQTLCSAKQGIHQTAPKNKSYKVNIKCGRHRYTYCKSGTFISLNTQEEYGKPGDCSVTLGQLFMSHSIILIT